jgi:hypothetical protein
MMTEDITHRGIKTSVLMKKDRIAELLLVLSAQRDV